MPNSASFTLFVHKFYANVDIDALHSCRLSHGIDFLVHFVMHAWNIIQKRIQLDSVINIVDADSLQCIASSNGISVSKENDFLLITLVNDDRPFLIDSLLLLLKNTSQHVKLMTHPVLRVTRDEDGYLQEIHNTLCMSKDNCNSESLISFIVHIDKNNPDQENLKTLLHETISHTISVVDDFSLCRDILQHVGEKYEAFGKSLSFPEDEQNQISSSEIGHFLQWLKNDYFVFLGARYFKSNVIEKDDKTVFSFDSIAHNMLEKNGAGLYRHKAFQTEIDLMPIAMRESDQQRYGFGTHMICDPNSDTSACKPLPFFSITKSPVRANVHRDTRIDCIEVMDLDKDGTLCGLYQFIGIFTRQFFNKSPFHIPILCNRVRRAFNRFEIDPMGHNGKILTAILATIPHDELFQFDDDGLHTFCKKALYQKQRPAVNIKIDPLGRFATILIFLPRDRYDPKLKSAVKKYLEKTLNGKVQSEHALISEQEFARMLVVIGYEYPHEVVFDIDKIESDINALSHTWQECFQNARHLDSKIIGEDIKCVFPEVYQKIYTPSDGIHDFKHALNVRSMPHKRSVAIVFNRKQGTFTLQIFDLSGGISLSELMPIFQNLNLYVLSESGFMISLADELVYLHNFECTMPIGFDARAADRLVEGFSAIWDGTCENDRFNGLIFQSTLTSRDVTIVRAIVRAMRQMQFSGSIDYVATILLMYPTIVQRLRDYFKVRFDPKMDEKRPYHMARCEAELNDTLQTITRSDHDRVIRHLFAVIKACVRTNVFQGKAYLSFKFRSENIPNLPKPVPLFEIFVYTTFMEGIHIRTGKVARGGIRWSDRLEDFRQEVLVLAKTQMIKNSIIIPLGAKGGFVSRRYEEMLQRKVNPALLKQEIVTCYQTFIRGLLDLTDNQKGEVCIPPHNVVCHDEGDPYLVVAADKGTASFSDYANALSQEYGFWLDDAFASGGSVGYDHKKMAITSRGAWISVQKHFEELGIDCQTTPFTVVGVGDMAGDIFGNGLLRSDKIRLIAAFNHQHIFLDPNPDEKTSFAERQRMFNLPTSTWADYDASIISKGGGIFKRDIKSIPISKEVWAALGLTGDAIEMAPELLIQCMLQAKVDLLWFGGIGTYVRARTETDFDVRDTHNDLLRIEANQLRCRIIGEGANLAMTQKARIEYALLGGRLNTDAIDNSAGVSCSDHEVNIKILFSNLMQAQRITRIERDQLLLEMTEDVAAHVLNDNLEQNRVLTWLQVHAQNDMDAYKQLINVLERNSSLPLNRKLESLPTDQEIDQRAHDQHGLTRPELAVVLAYSKIILFQRLLSETALIPIEYSSILTDYFPKALQKRFGQEICQHQLSNEIITTILSNQLLNHLGPVDAFEIVEMHNNDVWKTINAYSFVMGLFGERLHALCIHNPEYDAVLATRQLMMVYTRNHAVLTRLKQDQFDFVSNLSAWFACMPAHALPELFEFFCKTTSDKSAYNEKTLSDIYKKLEQNLGFSDFSELSKKLHLNAPWQRQTKAYLLDDWVSLQVKLVKFAHDTEKGRAWMNGITCNPEHAIRYENLEPVQVLSRVQNGTVKNDLGFISYFIRYFERIIDIT